MMKKIRYDGNDAIIIVGAIKAKRYRGDFSMILLGFTIY